MLAVPAAANAALDVTGDGAGGLTVTSTADAIEHVTIERTGAGALRISETGSTTVSTDASCAVDVDVVTAVACSPASGATVTVLLGALDDSLDARTATGIALVVNGGAGADTLRVGASGATRITDSTATDVIDLSHADAAVRVRYAAVPVLRLVASCAGCSAGAWNVRLPVSPGRVLLGPAADDVDLKGWGGAGRTAWTLGEGSDRWFGASLRRGIVDGGNGDDVLVSRAAADTMRGGAGMDKFADLGGIGDVLAGGPGIDAMSSLDGRRDTLDGGGDPDMCLSRTLFTSGCDTGPARSFVQAVYFPIVSQARVFQALGIH